MKILNAIHAQFIGGVDQVFRNYTEVLVANGHDVALLISDNGSDNYDQKKVFKLKNVAQILDCFHLFWILLTFRPDVILCHSNRLMKWMKILRPFTRAKSVAINHGITFKSSLCCDYIISINQQISDMVVAAGFDKARSFVLRNVIKIDSEYFLKKPKNPLVIGMYGRIEWRKGFDILIEAAGILAKLGTDFRLKIGGFEATKEYSLQLIKDLAKAKGILEKCSFVGVVRDKKEFFSDVDILCVPSREEPFGLVILEGFLFSTLVISSDTDGGLLLIENNKNGVLFKNGDQLDLANKITVVTKGNLDYGALTKSAFLRLEKEFSFGHLANEIEQILTKINQ